MFGLIYRIIRAAKLDYKVFVRLADVNDLIASEGKNYFGCKWHHLIWSQKEPRRKVKKQDFSIPSYQPEHDESLPPRIRRDHVDDLQDRREGIGGVGVSKVFYNKKIDCPPGPGEMKYPGARTGSRRP